MNNNTGHIENVIVTSDEPWSDIWHTQLHYGFQLSKRFKVIFVDPPKSWKFSHLFDFKPEIKIVSENLRVFRYKNFLPAFIGKLAIKVNDFINEKILKNNMPGLDHKSKLLVWHFDHFRSHFIFRNNPRVKHIYHVIDPVAGLYMDEEMALMADLVIITSPKFLSHYQALNKNVIQVGQGVDLDFFKVPISSEVLKSLVSYDSILLLGTFSDQLDFRFLHLLAERYPGKLVLIGPDKTSAPDKIEAIESLKSIPGVHWLGAMSPALFHKHLAACRVGIITYSYSNYEQNNLRSPLKVISYLACGKCIISNIDCEIPSLLNKAIYIVNNDESYFELFDSCYNNKLLFDEPAVQSYLQSIDYQKLMKSIFTKLDEQLPPLL